MVTPPIVTGLAATRRVHCTGGSPRSARLTRSAAVARGWPAAAHSASPISPAVASRAWNRMLTAATARSSSSRPPTRPAVRWRPHRHRRPRRCPAPAPIPVACMSAAQSSPVSCATASMASGPTRPPFREHGDRHPAGQLHGAWRPRQFPSAADVLDQAPHWTLAGSGSSAWTSTRRCPCAAPSAEPGHPGLQ